MRNINSWYSDEGGRGIPPVIHYLALSNFAWLKKPASATKLKLHELVALCSAALRPSRATWDRFVSYLKDLETSGELTTDELTAIVANDLTDRLLVDEGIDEDTDAASLSEVVERVKASYKSRSDAELSDAKLLAAEKDREAQDLRRRVESRAQGAARACSWALVGILGLAFSAGTVLSVLATASGDAPSPVSLALAIGPLAVAALLGVLWGFHLKAWRQTMENRLARLLAKWLAGI